LYSKSGIDARVIQLKIKKLLASNPTHWFHSNTYHTKKSLRFQYLAPFKKYLAVVGNQSRPKETGKNK